ncbi:MAG: alpha/beta hydrolase [Candidatus Competibacteraceae bacterium]|nr:alpha/beta hydrolase [Candidatus Competibacteraceae bacterium]
MPAVEQPVSFAAGSLRLEGRLCQMAGLKAALITHPHPLYGGDLDNPVVGVIAAAYQRRGYTTLRFNFRGVNASEGQYADGPGERDDVRAAATYLAERDKIVTDLAGYSFGAWINLTLAPPLASARRQLLVAPPLAFLDFSNLPEPVAEWLVIVGERDEFAPPARLREWLRRWQPTARLHVLPGTDHFYGDALDRLAVSVEALLDPSLDR